jgi:predicted transcriptional regulator
MGRTPQEDLQIERRRQQVAEFYLTGQTQAAIARELNVSQATVSADLKAIRQQWRDSSLRNFDEAVEESLRKYQVLEREAWNGWQRSQEPAETSRIVQGEQGRKAEKTVRQQVGDPRFLELVHRAITGRRALLGLDAPTRIAPTSPEGDEAYHTHVMRELLKLAEQSTGGPTVIDSEFIERQLAAELPPETASPDATTRDLKTPPEDHHDSTD